MADVICCIVLMVLLIILVVVTYRAEDKIRKCKRDYISKLDEHSKAIILEYEHCSKLFYKEKDKKEEVKEEVKQDEQKRD